MAPGSFKSSRNRVSLASSKKLVLKVPKLNLIDPVWVTCSSLNLLLQPKGLTMPDPGDMCTLNSENRMQSKGENGFLPYLSSHVLHHPKATGLTERKIDHRIFVLKSLQSNKKNEANSKIIFIKRSFWQILVAGHIGSFVLYFERWVQRQLMETGYGAKHSRWGH